MNKTLRRLMTFVIAFACVLIAGVAVTAPAVAKANDAWKDAARKLTFGVEDFDYTDDATKDKNESIYYKISLPAQLSITLTTNIQGNYADKNSGVERVKLVIRNSKGEVLKTVKDMTYDEATNLTTAVYSDTLAKGTYYIEIKEVVTSKGDKITIKADAGLAATPKFTKISQNAGKVTLKWSKVKAASYYTIYRSTSKNGEYTKVENLLGANSTKFTSKKLKSGKTYYYKVVAYLKTAKKTFASSESIIKVKVQ